MNAVGQLVFQRLHGINFVGDGGKPLVRHNGKAALMYPFQHPFAHGGGVLGGWGGQQCLQRLTRGRAGLLLELAQEQLLRGQNAKQAAIHRVIQRGVRSDHSIDRGALAACLFLGVDKAYIRRQFPRQRHIAGLRRHLCQHRQIGVDGGGVLAK